jgi:plastocyanin
MRSEFLSLVAVVALVGCGSGGHSVTGPGQGGNSATVDAVGATSWSPTHITIRAGEAATFRNATGIVHNLRFDETAGHPEDVADFVSASRSVVFTTAGTFDYHCGIHPAMQGQVEVVQP